MCVVSEVNDPSKEVKVRFMRKSGQYFLEKWFLKSSIFHRCSIPSIANRMHYSFDAGLQLRWTFTFANHSSNECNKKEVADIDILTLINYSCAKSPVGCSDFDHMYAVCDT